MGRKLILWVSRYQVAPTGVSVKWLADDRVHKAWLYADPKLMQTA